jgi:hypothetical protein
VLGLLELQIRLGRNVWPQVHTVNIKSRNFECKCSLFSKKNPIIWIYCITRWLSVPINPENWNSTVCLNNTRDITKVRSSEVHTQDLFFAAEDGAVFSIKCRVHVLFAIHIGGEFGRRINFMEFLAELMNRCS